MKEILLNKIVPFQREDKVYKLNTGGWIDAGISWTNTFVNSILTSPSVDLTVKDEIVQNLLELIRADTAPTGSAHCTKTLCKAIEQFNGGFIASSLYSTMVIPVMHAFMRVDEKHFDLYFQYMLAHTGCERLGKGDSRRLPAPANGSSTCQRPPSPGMATCSGSGWAGRAQQQLP